MDDSLRALPDPQNQAMADHVDLSTAIDQVGTQHFKMPLLYQDCLGKPVSLPTVVSNSVSLKAHKRGINMSRLPRVLYDFKDRLMDFDTLEQILQNYLEQLEADTASIKLVVDYPLEQESLLSGLRAWQYYPLCLEARLADSLTRILHFQFTYSSACPCSSELARHAQEHKATYSIPHSQRSKASLSCLLKEGENLSVKMVRDTCERVLKTETQVLVKREDEQAFAELNGRHPKFVEDAARLLYAAFNAQSAIDQFAIYCAHFESLHNYNATATLYKGDSFKGLGNPF